jgi:type VI secretion system protein ImpH
VAAVKPKLDQRLEQCFQAPWNWRIVEVLRLLEAARYPDDGLPPYPDRDLVLAPAADLSYPAADVRRARLVGEGDRKLRMLEINAMALSGPDAPRPHYLVAEVKGPGQDALSDLLALFNHRLYTLSYQAERLEELLSATSPARSFGGFLPPGKPAGDSIDRIHAYRGANRSRSGLETGLRQLWPGLEVSVLPPRTTRLPVPPARLGSELHLGKNTVMGDSVPVASRCVDIALFGSRERRLRPFFPGEREWPRLVRAIHALTPRTMTSRVLFRRNSKPHDGFRLGDHAALGWDTPLGTSPTGYWSLPVGVPPRDSLEGDSLSPAMNNATESAA